MGAMPFRVGFLWFEDSMPESVTPNTDNDGTPRRRLPITVILDDDTPVWGCANIARVIGRTEAQTYYMLENGTLDGAVKKVGGRWCGRPSKLREAVS